MYNDAWGGYPDAEFLAAFRSEAGRIALALRPKAHTIDRAVGGLTSDWAARTGLPAGIPVAVGAFDAHLGGVGQRHRAGHAGQDHRHEHVRHDGRAGRRKAGGHPRPVRHRQRQHPAGLLRPGSGPVGRRRHLQLVRELHQPGGGRPARTSADAAAAKLAPGESGLLALDWNNGNRTILVDQRLTGLLLGQTLYTTPAEIYRALIEATASAR
jgi:L-ribulokinase